MRRGGAKLTCSSREKDPKDCKEIFSWAVVRHCVSAEQPRWITNEAMLWNTRQPDSSVLNLVAGSVSCLQQNKPADVPDQRFYNTQNSSILSAPGRDFLHYWPKTVKHRVKKSKSLQFGQVYWLNMHGKGGVCSRLVGGVWNHNNLKGPSVLQHRTFPCWLSCDGKECVLSD